MAVSVDTVYQKVLAFANKEQRGYITPQEFNLFADQAQMEIFEQYFYDKNQFGRVPGNSYQHSDMIDRLDEKISIFQIYDRIVKVNYSSSATNSTGRGAISRSWGDALIEEQAAHIYRLGMVRVSYDGKSSNVAEKISLNELNEYGGSPLGKWTKDRPVYIEYPSRGKLRIKIYPYPSSNVVDGGPSRLVNGVEVNVDRVAVSYVRKPLKPNWGYVVVNDKPLYNATSSQDFELHLAEESELVYRILAYVGIAIEKPQLTQMATGLEGAKQQQEKQ